MGNSSRPSGHAFVLTGALLIIACALAESDASARTEASTPASARQTASGSKDLSTRTTAERADISTRPDSVLPEDLIQPEELARLLADSTASRPRILQIGFRTLYGAAHIAGAQYIGAASDPKGLRALKAALRPLPRRQPLVLYCGCCPWDDCPNVRPALRAARLLGFKNARVLFIVRNLGSDWIDKGFPTKRYKG